MKHTLWLPLLLACNTSAPDSSEAGCCSDYISALRVSVVGADGASFLLSSVYLTQEGEDEATLMACSSYLYIEGKIYCLLYEDASNTWGTFTLSAEANGYLPAQQTVFVSTEDGCFPIPQDVSFVLEPL